MNLKTIAVLASLALALTGCGGGSKSEARADDTPPEIVSTTTHEIVVNVTDPALNETNNVERDGRLIITATLIARTTRVQAGQTLSDTSTAVPNVLLQFESGAGGFDPQNGVAETDANGDATVALTATAITGGYLVDVRSVEGSDIMVNTAFNVNIVAPPFPAITVMFDGPTGNALTAGDEITVIAQATQTDNAGNSSPLIDLPIIFGTDGGVFNPSAPIDRTDEMGFARATFQAGFAAGLFTLSATAEFAGSDLVGSEPYTIELPPVTFDAPVASPSVIPARGQAEITFVLTTPDGAFDAPVDIRLTSECVEDQEQMATLPSSARTANGMATVTYSAGNCVGFDTITAQPFLQGASLTAPQQTTIEILPPELTTIFFDKASSSAVSIAELDNPQLPDTTVLTFQVQDAFGDPAPGAFVLFELLNNFDPTVSIDTERAQTDQSGAAEVTLTGGNVPSAPRVRARLEGTNLEAISEAIAVTTGVPDQDSLSLSASILNVEGWQFDGKVTLVTARVADHYNNVIADGTPILFRAEGGAIEPACFTLDGACTVSLVSQSPRPADGRIHVLAHTVGDETFSDLNGSGFRDPDEPFTDLGEPFEDTNENGVRDPNEEIIDTNQDGMHSPPNGRYDGILCRGADCGGAASTDIRDSLEIVFSTSFADIDLFPSANFTIDQVNPRAVQVRVSDGNGNQMPAGTTIVISTDNGELSGTQQFTVANSNAPGPFTANLTIVGDDSPSTGLLLVTVTTPMDVITTAQVQVSDILNCGFSPTPPECMDDDDG